MVRNLNQVRAWAQSPGVITSAQFLVNNCSFTVQLQPFQNSPVKTTDLYSLRQRQLNMHC